MSNTKYNNQGEVVSVNGLTTGQQLGTPMQDALAEKPEDNLSYSEERNTVTRAGNCVEDKQPIFSGSGGADVIPTPSSASVGQTIRVKGVDENGKPTEWEAVDYQPRTHYSEFTEEIIIDEDGILTTESEDYFPTEASLSTNVDYFVPGDTYRVIFNGIVYNIVAKDKYYIGNDYFDSGDEEDDNGMPFIIYCEDGIICTVEPMSVAVKVIHICEEVTAIPDKYLPNEYDLIVGFTCPNRQLDLTSDSFFIVSGSAKKVISLLRANKPVKVALIGERYDNEDDETLNVTYFPDRLMCSDNISFDIGWQMLRHEYSPPGGCATMMLSINNDNTIGRFQFD